MDTTLRVIKMAPCTDEVCWRAGTQDDCASCVYRKDHAKEDTVEENRRNAA